MNRPTRNTLFGVVLCLALSMAYSCKKAAAQTAIDPQKNEYDRCVFGAISDQKPSKLSVAVAAENAFRACATEEQAMISTLMLMPGSDFNLTVAAVTNHKLQIKRIAREMMK